MHSEWFMEGLAARRKTYCKGCGAPLEIPLTDICLECSLAKPKEFD